MFGGRDPRNPFDAYFVINQMNRHINQLDTMMDQLMDPISATHASIFHGVPRAMRASPLEMIYPRQPSQTLQPMDAPMMGMMNPFGFGGMFGGLMGQMNSLQHHAMNDPNAHAFSHSTFISFDGSGSGPHVVHSSVRRAGDATETRHSVHRGGEAEEISVGHRIGNRSHTIEKKRDAEGRLRGQQLFENLDDGEAASFDREFQRRVRRSFGGHNRDYLAVQDNEIRGTRRPAGRDSSTADVNRANVPIITIPDDDDEEPVLSARAQRARDRGQRTERSRGFIEPSVVYANSAESGVTIRELSDDEADAHINKRPRRRL
ncbi:hypothetical protein L596_002543 [Steinernema carpocapsae]|uniref:Myeloid leukemia factor n=1 Tax=Steinernema carpocapsae TaxID=34508 RepID=A0A4U8UTH9_STECR|nr:hypothetical protein L596_002543 [Steinernema carpocapsae]